MTSCSRIFFTFWNDDIRDIRYFEKPESKMTPMAKEMENPQKLTGFNWIIDQKPLDPDWLMKGWQDSRKQAVKLFWESKEASSEDQIEPETIPLVPLEEPEKMIESQPNENKNEQN